MRSARAETWTSKIRVVIAKPGLDGHDRGAKVIARALRDAGMEVIYTGLRQTPEQIVGAALQEDADVIGLSILSGAHMHICPRVVELLQREGARRRAGGGRRDHSRRQDLPKLHALGITGVFIPGTPMQAIVDFITHATPATRARRLTARSLHRSEPRGIELMSVATPTGHWSSSESRITRRVVEMTFADQPMQLAVLRRRPAPPSDDWQHAAAVAAHRRHRACRRTDGYALAQQCLRAHRRRPQGGR